MPWHLRIFSVVVLLLLMLALAFWVFDFGRQLAGADQNEISSMQASNAMLKEEVDRLRGLLTASENNLQIEKAAQKELAEKHSALVEENTRLKEELAVLERLTAAQKK